jgi:phospholipase C
MTALTRRRFLGGAAAGAGAASLSLLPISVQKALAATPKRAPRMRDIEHVVLLMQENRSFDHYFGTLSGVAGFDDPAAMQLPSGRSVFHQPDPVNPSGYLLPFHLDTKTSSAQAMPSTSHSWSTQHAAWNHGAMDTWMRVHRSADQQNAPYVMGYYTRADIPFQYALADAFTICDQYHCSVMGPTAPNRMYWMTGTIDPDAKHGGPVTTDRAPAKGYRWKTYAERLQAAGVPWRVYQEADSYGCAVLQNFATFRNAPRYSQLYKNGLAICSDGQFEHDAKHDQLPAVSWLIPTSTQCEHPNHLPAAGADYVASKIAAIASNPDVWAKTAFILNYDENDGLFDHVPPPTPPAKTAQEFVHGVPVGAGFRVPCIIVSPWTAGGWVASEKFDHTSVLRFLERFTGVREANISPWRRSTFGDLTSAFRFGQPVHRPPSLPKTGPQLAEAEHAAATYPPPHLGNSTQRLPHQERGRRRHT